MGIKIYKNKILLCIKPDYLESNETSKRKIFSHLQHVIILELIYLL